MWPLSKTINTIVVNKVYIKIVARLFKILNVLALNLPDSVKTPI